MLFEKVKETFTLEIKHDVSIMTSLHYHEHYEMYFLLSGTQNYFIENEQYKMAENSVCLIKSWELHKTKTGMGGHRFVLNFDDSFLNHYFTENSKKVLLHIFELPLIPFPNDASKIKNCLICIDQYLKNKDMDNVYIHFVNLFRLLMRCAQQKDVSLQTKEDSPIETITKYISEHYSTIENLDEVASALHISKYHICRLFSKHLDTTFSHFLSEVKLKSAEKYILTTNKNISQIAELCGFNTTTQFCFAFRQKFGFPPLKYRNINKLNE